MSSDEKLLRAHRLLGVEHDFSPGQLVTWKPGLKDQRRPELAEPMIIVEFHDGPRAHRAGAAGGEVEAGDADRSGPTGPAAEWERLDVVAGWLDEDDQMVVSSFDRRRLQPFVDIAG